MPVKRRGPAAVTAAKARCTSYYRANKVGAKRHYYTVGNKASRKKAKALAEKDLGAGYTGGNVERFYM